MRKFLKEIMLVFIYIGGESDKAEMVGAIRMIEALFDMTCKCAIVSS